MGFLFCSAEETCFLQQSKREEFDKVAESRAELPKAAKCHQELPRLAFSMYIYMPSTLASTVDLHLQAPGGVWRFRLAFGGCLLATPGGSWRLSLRVYLCLSSR